MTPEIAGYVETIRGGLYDWNELDPDAHAALDALVRQVEELEKLIGMFQRASDDNDQARAALRAENAALRAQIEAHRCGLPSSIVEALNSGDGTYRP